MTGCTTWTPNPVSKCSFPTTISLQGVYTCVCVCVRFCMSVCTLLCWRTKAPAWRCVPYQSHEQIWTPSSSKSALLAQRWKQSQQEEPRLTTDHLRFMFHRRHPWLRRALMTFNLARLIRCDPSESGELVITERKKEWQRKTSRAGKRRQKAVTDTAWINLTLRQTHSRHCRLAEGIRQQWRIGHSLTS